MHRKQSGRSHEIKRFRTAAAASVERVAAVAGRPMNGISSARAPRDTPGGRGMVGLLAGTRVLDLTNVLAGPFCCYQLAQLGAEVIKVEVPGSGDLARQLGADPELNRRGMGASFLAQNAGKRSITLNLKSPKGREAFRRLVATSDVVVENFRPGVMDRLGLGYAALNAVKHDIVYCAISGFGQDGPLQVQSGLRPDHPGPVRGDERHRRRRHRRPCGSAIRWPTRSAASPPPSPSRPRCSDASAAARASSSTCRCWKRRWSPWAGRSRTG